MMTIKTIKNNNKDKEQQIRIKNNLNGDNNDKDEDAANQRSFRIKREVETLRK